MTQTSAAPAEGTHALDLLGITKHYGATIALDQADVHVRRGEVHALLGENGAGKSTLVKVLSGLIRPDAGEIDLFGERVRINGAREAHLLGIQTAFQEISLLPNLTVAQNLLLPYEPVNAVGQIRAGEAMRRAAGILDELGIAGIDPRVEVRGLDLPQRQRIEIARAASRNPRVLLLDELTSALSGDDLDWLFALVRRMREQGTTILFITHRMPEVRAICDSLTVLRNGKDVGTFRAEAVSDADIVRLVIGRSLAATYPAKETSTRARPAAPALAGKSVATEARLHELSFELWPGEVLGIGALQGMGQLELFRALFGMEPVKSGRLEIDGRRVTLASPKDAIKAHIGISLLPEERKTEGLFLRLSGSANVSLPIIDRFARFGWIDRRREDVAVRQVLDLVQVHRRAMYMPCSVFSGGNQQKIAIAKWLFARCRVLLMYDPARGVDIGTKHEIYLLMRAFVRAGGSILFYSTDLPELANLCDRVLVLYRGRLVASLTGAEISEEAIMHPALGHAPAPPAP